MAFSIRDPLHGTIELEKHELEIISHPALQRLRNIKQLGFADLSYPGATHSRFLHSVGAMSVVSRIWQTLQKQISLSPTHANKLHKLLRATVLLHDIGHSPFSHCTEHAMPPLKDLNLEKWLPLSSPEQRAGHEDYTLKLLLDSSLTKTLQRLDLEPKEIVQLISGVRFADKSPFQVNGIDLYPLMRQLVSSELDADRMDYLLRDSLFTGVSYGKYDPDWLIKHLRPIPVNDQLFLGLDSRAIFSLEDFLLSRYHMFFSVYYHHTSVCYQEMISHYFQEAPEEYPIPSQAEEYLKTDDIQLTSVLRKSHNPWARRIVGRKPYKKLFEFLLPKGHADKNQQEYDNSSMFLFNMSPIPKHLHKGFRDPSARLQFYETLQQRLKEEGIAHFQTESNWSLSRYYPQLTHDEPTLYIYDRGFQEATPFEDYSSLYQRYAETTKLLRIYCEPTQLEKAQKLLL